MEVKYYLSATIAVELPRDARSLPDVSSNSCCELGNSNGPLIFRQHGAAKKQPINQPL